MEKVRHGIQILKVMIKVKHRSHYAKNMFKNRIIHFSLFQATLYPAATLALRILAWQYVLTPRWVVKINRILCFLYFAV